MSSDTIYQQLREHLHYLGLRAAADTLAPALENAEKTKPGYTQFLHDLLATEVQAAEQRRLQGRLRFAKLPARQDTRAVRLQRPAEPRSPARRGPRDAQVHRAESQSVADRPARSWFTVHLSVQGVSSRSKAGAGTLMASPLRRPRVTWIASSSPRWTLCNTVWRAQPSASAGRFYRCPAARGSRLAARRHA